MDFLTVRKRPMESMQRQATSGEKEGSSEDRVKVTVESDFKDQG